MGYSSITQCCSSYLQYVSESSIQNVKTMRIVNNKCAPVESREAVIKNWGNSLTREVIGYCVEHANICIAVNQNRKDVESLILKLLRICV